MHYALPWSLNMSSNLGYLLSASAIYVYIAWYFFALIFNRIFVFNIHLFISQFRLLAELVKSYGSCAALITEHVFESGMSDLVKEDTTALAFLLDELLVSKSADKECSNLIKTLVAALASCNHFPEAQSTLVMEVKGKFRFCCFF